MRELKLEWANQAELTWINESSITIKHEMGDWKQPKLELNQYWDTRSQWHWKTHMGVPGNSRCFPCFGWLKSLRLLVQKCSQPLVLKSHVICSHPYCVLVKQSYSSSSPSLNFWLFGNKSFGCWFTFTPAPKDRFAIEPTFSPIPEVTPFASPSTSFLKPRAPCFAGEMVGLSHVWRLNMVKSSTSYFDVRQPEIWSIAILSYCPGCIFWCGIARVNTQV